MRRAAWAANAASRSHPTEAPPLRPTSPVRPPPSSRTLRGRPTPEPRRLRYPYRPRTFAFALSHILYALCGDGRGHSSRARAVASVLEGRGHRVTFACDDPAASRLEADGLAVRRVPGLRQVMRGNRVRLLETARANMDLTWQSPEIIGEAAGWLVEDGVEVVVSDHEPFVARAARRVGVPVVALSHQHILTETRPRVPLRHWPSALGTALGIGVLAPRGPAAVVVPSFFFPPLRRRSRATLVPPILRDDVLEAEPHTGDRLLVYVNEGDGMDGLLRVLEAAGAPADVYGLGGDAPPNVTLQAPSRAGFLAHLAACRAVVSTAGFTLLSEALHLGKPVLALPNRGFFEQALNALALEDAGRGEALQRDVRASDLEGFLSHAASYRRPPATEGTAGREAAADVVEGVLEGVPAPALALAT